MPALTIGVAAVLTSGSSSGCITGIGMIPMSNGRCGSLMSAETSLAKAPFMATLPDRHRLSFWSASSVSQPGA